MLNYSRVAFSRKDVVEHTDIRHLSIQTDSWIACLQTIHLLRSHRNIIALVGSFLVVMFCLYVCTGESDDDLFEEVPTKLGVEETVVHDIELERGKHIAY